MPPFVIPRVSRSSSTVPWFARKARISLTIPFRASPAAERAIGSATKRNFAARRLAEMSRLALRGYVGVNPGPRRRRSVWDAPGRHDRQARLLQAGSTTPAAALAGTDSGVLAESQVEGLIRPATGSTVAVVREEPQRFHRYER